MTSGLLLLPPLTGIDDLSVPISFPVQALAAAVAEALTLPLQRDTALGTHRVCAIYWEQADLSHRHGLPKGPGRAPLTHTASSSHSRTSSRNSSAKRSRFGWGRTDTP